MQSLLASVRDGGGLDRVDHAVQLLEDEWRKHGDVPLERLWAEQRRSPESDADEPVILLAELIRTDLRCRFARDQTPTVADYLGRFPELNSAGSRVLSLIYEEFCLKEERGDPVDVESFCDRYPRWKESLVSQLQYHHLFGQAAGGRPEAPPFPEAGDTFEEFQLVSLLGRGGTSRVFLARDLSLGGKQVVLKVSLDRGREPQAQGALDHPHIVPVNSVVFSDREMRGLSMPYRPGLPLDEVIRRVDPASKPRRAMALWEALVRAPGAPIEPSKADVPAVPEDHAPGPRGDGWDGFPVRGTFPQGVAWIVKVIAEALYYAHGQQTYHRDVKPANVLLTRQHGPQLLDFNLAESPHSASQAQAAMHGGTLPYMAPEQIEAFLNPDLWGKVGAKADIYSLGLVLRELLTGQAPDLPAQTMAPARAMRVLLDRRPFLDVSVRRTNPAIPHALEAIVAKCLTVSPEDRYPDACALAEDLDRFLQRKPLAHAVNPSRRERCANWSARNRARLAVVAACLVGMIAGRSMTASRPSIHVDWSATMQSVLKSLDEHRAGESIQLLSLLRENYPKSSILTIYLGLAHDADGDDKDAEPRFSEAQDMPNAAGELVDWSKEDPRLGERLEHFIDRRIQRAFESVGNKILSENDREQRKKKEYRLAKQASLYLVKIQPHHESSLYRLAISEQGLDEYEPASRLADEAIDLIRSQKAVDLDVDKRVRRLFVWRWFRCHVLTKLADQRRTAGPKSDPEGARKALGLADQDLHACDFFVGNEINAEPDMAVVEKLRVDALMTRVEIDLDLGKLEDAKAHLKRSRDTLHKYDALVKKVDRIEDTAGLYVRLRAIERRLQDEARKAGGDSAHRTEVTADGTPRAQ
jgi:serine/threonine protein kinase